jgi:formylmethanofuran dehydrogenase subunit E-like metal-binding protein
MTNEIIETMNKLGKSNYDAMKELYDINLKIASQISDQQMAIVNLALECATTQMDMIGKSKGYKDIFSGQTSLINDTSEKVQGIARNTVDIMNESKDEVSAWVEKGVEEASTIIPFAKKSAA